MYLSYCSPPFLASNQIDLAAKVATGKVKPIPSHYSSELQTTVMKLLQVSPELRPDVDTVFRSTHTLMLMLKEKELSEMERKLVKWQRHLEKRELELDDKERELKSKPLVLYVSLNMHGDNYYHFLWSSAGAETVHKEFDRKPLISVNKPTVA